MSDSELKGIYDILDDIRAILTITNSKQLQLARESALKSGSEQERVYNLCTGQTAEEIALAMQKTPEYVRANISQLRKKGLIKTMDRNSKKVYEQRF